MKEVKRQAEIFTLHCPLSWTLRPALPGYARDAVAKQTLFLLLCEKIPEEAFNCSEGVNSLYKRIKMSRCAYKIQ